MPRHPSLLSLGSLVLVMGCLLSLRSASAAELPAADGQWSLIPFPAAGPATTIYDPLRDRLMVFQRSAWSLSLSGAPAWSLLATDGSPAGTSEAALIYDPPRDRVLAIGGFRSGYGNAVWALPLTGPAEWSELSPTGTPPAGRVNAGVVYDSARDRVVLFGGSNGSTLADTWALSLSGELAWSELTPAGELPATRDEHFAAYDPVHDRMIVSGGYSYQGDPRLRTPLSDVWTLSLAEPPTWAQLAPAGTPPAYVYAGRMAFDPIRNRLVHYSSEPADSSAVFTLSLGESPEWARVTTEGVLPPFRWDCAMVYDPPRDRMLMFGGQHGYSVFGDTWALALTAPPTWDEVAPAMLPDGSPGARFGHTAVLDPMRHRVLVFGGENQDFQYSNDVWELTAGPIPAWRRLTPTGDPPAGRMFHTAVYDPVRDRMLVFGGTGTSMFSDVWALALSDPPAWSLIAPAGLAPSARYGHAAIYDPVRDRMVVFGGFDGAMRNDLWTLSCSEPMTWTQLAPAGGSPRPRRWHTATYVPGSDIMVVYGGASSAEQTWVLAFGLDLQWVPVVPPGTAPAPRQGHMTAYDGRRNRLLVFGGLVPATSSNETWALDLGTPAPEANRAVALAPSAFAWSLLSPAGPLPPARAFGAAVFDAERDGLVLFAGGPTPSLRDDAWMLGFDFATPALASLVSAGAFVDRTELVWQLGSDRLASATVYRSDETGTWKALGSRAPDGMGRVTCVDRSVIPGHRYGYRLGFTRDGAEIFAGETWLDVPAGLAFALNGARPNPSAGRVGASFELPSARHAMLELLDTAGRTITSREVGSLGAGRHVLDMTPERPLASGIYWLRLRQGDRAHAARVAVVR